MGKSGRCYLPGYLGASNGCNGKITNLKMKDDGCVPKWVVWLVRFTVCFIWLSHDAFFGPVFGRGDGHGDSCYRESPVTQKGLDLERQLLLSELKNES